MKLKLDHWFPKYFLSPLGFQAITLFPYVLVASPAISIYIARHEFQHGKQIERYGIARFYFTYLRDYVRNLFKYWNFFDAYYYIPFEIQARKAERRIYDEDFLAWVEKVALELTKQ